MAKATMQTLAQGYRGVSLLIGLNWDRLLSVVTIVGALWAGAFIGSLTGF
ncbi:hypothetical protein [Histidinibacterium aquaticum]|nr:hypothetical protein [Histidinibacterium aquaticum]